MGLDMIRVIHYIGSLEFGGSQSFVMELYRKIDRCKVQFDFVVFDSKKEGFYHEIMSLGGRVYESPKYNGKNHFSFMKWWNDFFLNHSEYKVFHCHVRSVASLCIGTAHRYGIYSIAHSHSTSNGKGLSSCVKYVMQLPIRFQADYMFACSETAGKWLFGKNIEKNNNYSLIYNSIDSDRFSYCEEKRLSVRRQLNIEDKFVIGHVGRFTEPKNHQFLLKIVSEICKTRDDVVLILVGDGELRSSIEKSIHTYDIQKNVILTGSRSNTQDFYQAMDVFVFPSLWEGLGIVAIEAQASGLPCIVSERIPKEVDIGAGLVSVLNLDDSIQTWINEIEKHEQCQRTGQFNLVKDSGYDIACNAEFIQKFYLTIDNNRRKKCTY